MRGRGGKTTGARRIFSRSGAGRRGRFRPAAGGERQRRRPAIRDVREKYRRSAGWRRGAERGPFPAGTSLQGRGRFIDKRGNDVARPGLASDEGDQVAVEDMRAGHGIASDAEKPEMVLAGRVDAEDGGIEGDHLLGRLFLHGRKAGGDRPVDGRGEKVPLDLDGLEAPFAVGELVQLALAGERLQVFEGRRLAALKGAGDFTRRRGHAVLALVFVDEVQNFFLSFGEHRGIK